MLRTVERHLADDRLHIVAAPGAGKTTLGLEIFRRLGKPALTLAPTLTIRDQWLLRIHDFLPLDATDEDREWLAAWTSTDLSVPGFLTITTYQALLSQSRVGEKGGRHVAPARAPSVEDVTRFTERLREAGVGTLILDEAHHLRQEWWKALQTVVEALDGVTVLSLTATPPYDAKGHEWRRYEELCGPIDDEISVPELVKAGTLCPHQDFVYAVAPTEPETAGLQAHDLAVATTLADLLDAPEFQHEVERHPWITTAAPDLTAVLERPELAVALLAYLRASGARLPPALLGAMELDSGQLPALDRRWWQTLLEEYLHGTTFEADEESRRALAKRLRASGLLWRRRLRLVRSSAVERSLALSGAKTQACVDIHRAERDARGDSLRQAILTDFIHDETLPDEPPVGPAELGAFPIFNLLTSGAVGDSSDIAMVSGRLSIIHESRAGELTEALAAPEEVRFSPLSHRPGWIRVEGPPSGRLVAAVTRLLSDGRIRVIVGTRALLGEGWDAPPLNSLILASYVGAYVSTNQMRGRAIRTDPGDREKVASVWHLVAVPPQVPTGILDLQQLRARFSTFVGLAADGTAIGSGIDRLGLPELSEDGDLHGFNRVSLDRLRGLPDIAEAWNHAIASGTVGQVVPTVNFRRPPTLRPLHVRNTLRRVLHQTLWAGVAGGGEVLRSVLGGGFRSVGTALVVGGAVPFLVLAPRLYRTARLALRHAPLDGSLTQIGCALVEALRETQLLEGDGLSVGSYRLPDGSVQVSLTGGTFHDQSLFADALADLLGPVGNPRYLITRPSTWGLRGTLDYHAVPHVLAGRRESAEALHHAWRKHVGEGDLIYTRREGGRALLLAARARAFANQFVDTAERLDRWQ